MRFLGKHYRQRCLVILSAVLVAALVAACAPARPAASPAEGVHASYLDLSGNISDLRARVAEWQKGDEASLNIAGEKLERIEAVVGSVAWPAAMAGAIAKTKAAIGPMEKALHEKDPAAAEAVAKELGDASHDVIHTFYDYWLPGLDHSALTSMAPHASYLDLSANISDLQARIAQWEKGDEASLNIAKEKAERIEVLVHHMAASGVLLKRVEAIEGGLPAVTKALEHEDVRAAQQALKPIVDASDGLARDFYVWMDIAAGAKDADCVQASYLDLSRNISALRAGVAAWQKGDEAGLDKAKERLARVEVVIAHPAWPNEMAGAIKKTKGTVGSLAKALAEKDPAAAEVAVADLGEVSHDVTHDFYDWLPSARVAGGKAHAESGATTGAAKSHGDSHAKAPAAGGHGAATDEDGVQWPIVGGFVGLLALVVVGAGVTKRKAAAYAAQAGDAIL